MEAFFGGPIYQLLHRTWKKSLQVEGTGEIFLGGCNDELQVAHLGIDQNDIDKALKHIGNFAMAAGKLYVNVKQNDAARVDDAQVAMSGFWLDKDKFITGAHFLEVVEGADTLNTVESLRDSALTSCQAFVSTARISADKTYDGIHSWPVYLLSLDRSADLAVFGLKPEVAKMKGNPPHSVDFNSLGSIYTADNPDEVDPLRPEGHVLYQNLFAAYYPGSPCTVEKASLGQNRKDNAHAANVKDAWEWMGHETRRFHKENNGVVEVDPIPHYSDTFTSCTRSIAFGKIVSSEHINVPHQEPSKLAHARHCDIVGYWGCSGGMVCQFKYSGGAFKAKVIGLFLGETPNAGSNQILVFTLEGVKELQKILAHNDVELCADGMESC